MYDANQDRENYAMIAAELASNGYLDAASYVASSTKVSFLTDRVRDLKGRGPMQNSMNLHDLETRKLGIGSNEYYAENYMSSVGSKGVASEDFIMNSSFTKRSPTQGIVQSPDGLYSASATCSGEVYVHRNADFLQSGANTKISANRKPFRLFSNSEEEITSLDFHPLQPLVFSGSTDSKVMTYSLSSEKSREAVQCLCDSKGIVSLKAHPSGTYVLYSIESGDIRWYNIQLNETYSTKAYSKSDKKDYYSQLAVEETGQSFAAVTNSESISIFDGRSAKCAQLMPNVHGQSEKVTSIAYSRTGNLLLSSGSSRQAILWDLRKNCSPLQSFSTPATDIVQKVDFSWKEDAIICASTTGTLLGLSIQNQTPIFSLEHPCSIHTFAASKVSETIVTSGSDMQLRFWRCL